jgi:hypothetical protein
MLFTYNEWLIVALTFGYSKALDTPFQFTHIHMFVVQRNAIVVTAITFIPVGH